MCMGVFVPRGVVSVCVAPCDERDLAPKSVRCSLCGMLLSLGMGVLAHLPCKLTLQVLLINCVYFNTSVLDLCYFTSPCSTLSFQNLSNSVSAGITAPASPLNSFGPCRCMPNTMNLVLRKTGSETATHQWCTPAYWVNIEPDPQFSVSSFHIPAERHLHHVWLHHVWDPACPGYPTLGYRDGQLYLCKWMLGKRGCAIAGTSHWLKELMRGRWEPQQEKKGLRVRDICLLIQVNRWTPLRGLVILVIL